MNGRSSRIAISLLAAAFGLVGTAWPQSSPTLQETLNINVVEVPITVVDRSGAPVRGLSPENFEILDEGKKVDVAYFEVVDSKNLVENRRANPAARLHVVLLFDLTNSSPGTIERVRLAALHFVREELRPSDLVAAATYSIDHGFHLLTSFTNDRDLLDLAIETLGDPQYFRVADPLLLSAERPNASQTSSGGSALGSQMAQELEDVQKEFDRMNRDTHDQYMIGRIRTQLDSFGAFARMLDGIPGRKQVVLLSEGFDARYVHGHERTNEQAREDSDAILSGEIWKVSSEQRYGYTETKTDLVKMANMFRRSDVVMHAIDIKGLRADVDAVTGYKRISNEALFLMTNPTGGEVFKNANDLGTSFEKLMKQQEVVYVLGFHARAAGSPGSFHDLKVRMIDVPGARAAHRAGYYEPTDDPEAMEATLSAADILLNDIPQPGIPLSALAVPFPSDGGDSKIAVIIEIPGPALIAGAKDRQFGVDLYVYAFDGKNSVRDFLHQRVSIDLDKIGDALQQTGIKFYGALSLPPGEYAVKALVAADLGSHRGFTRQDVRIPGMSEPLLLPPLLFEDEGKWIMVKARPRSSDEVPYPFHVAQESFVPAAGVRLQAGESYKMALFARHVDYNESKIRAGLRFESGTASKADLSVVGSARDEDEEINKLVLRFDTKGLDPGRYTLDFALGEPGSEQRTSMPFVIDPQ